MYNGVKPDLLQCRAFSLRVYFIAKKHVDDDFAAAPVLQGDLSVGAQVTSRGHVASMGERRFTFFRIRAEYAT